MPLVRESFNYQIGPVEKHAEDGIRIAWNQSLNVRLLKVWSVIDLALNRQ